MAEQTLLNRIFDRSADVILSRLVQNKALITKARIWLFEDRQRRHEIKAILGGHGINAHVYSAYKPLVHFFLEEVCREELLAVEVTYPVHPACNEVRFKLEAYPLARMLPEAALRFTPARVRDENANLWYEVHLRYATHHVHKRILAPNALREDFLGQQVLNPTAWLVSHAQGKVTHTPVTSEYQQCHDAIMQAVMAHRWGDTEPYFDRLVVKASLPGIERCLNVGHETISTTEAMHEDIYFSLLEFFQHHSGRESGSRTLQPGQIVPDIRLEQKSPPHVTVTFEPATQSAEKTDFPLQTLSGQQNTPASLDTARAPLTQHCILDAVSCFKGDHFTFESRQGRPVRGVHIKGPKPAVLLSAGQHANETTGVVGALRAAAQLCRDPGAHLILLPLENPDGYALHGDLCKHNPRHMHHAARYSALGDDIEYREHAPWYARRARNHALNTIGARLHVNLHGYPAHEWTRPLIGYLPRGFEAWSIPKGFFLILRHRPDSKARAGMLLRHVTARLSDNAALADYNASQLHAYRQHTDNLPFQIVNDIPCMVAAAEGMSCDVTLITEFPDETIHGDDFIFGHAIQCETAMATTRWWWQ